MPEPVQLAVAAAQLRHNLVLGSDFLTDIPAPVYAVKPIIQMAQVTAITAHPNHGKSAFTFLLVVGILTGYSIGPFTFKKGKVAILAGENVDNVKVQMMAALLKYRVPRDLWENVVIYPIRKSLETATREVILECAARNLGPFVAVIVDTSSAYFGGDDENSNVDAQHQASSLRALSCEQLGRPAVIVNCHPTKSAGRDNLVPRGGGAFIGELDQNLTVWNDGGLLNVSYTKIRGAPFDPYTVALRDQDVGFSNGEVTQIPVAVPLNEQEEQDARRVHTEQEAQVLAVVEQMPDAPMSGWAEHLGWMLSDGKPNKTMVLRALRRLEHDKKVSRVDGKWIIDSGRKRK